MELFVFTIITAAFLLVWGRMLWYFAIISPLINRMVRYLMRFSQESQEVLRSALLSLLYYIFTLAGITLLTLYSGIKLSNVLAFRLNHLPLTILAFLTQLMLMSLFLSLLTPVMNIFFQVRPESDVRSVPWINGIFQLRHKFLMVLVPGISGFFEEFFFRGVLLTVLIEKFHLSVWVAIMFATTAFVAQQLLQLQSPGQMFIIGTSCIIISIVGSFLFLYTGSIVPPAMVHAAFAMFYMEINSQG